ncbi:uncharacterized protein MYCFIDRAFT_212032 [Pseudocercospora fijiensis CIRAD86]|uniref:Myb-like domain-containing protein n=1 Tax=Pseudocercospora fijiensis (strain CIRAD86) TaxID=383855 RepID=M2YRJ6_PSEFD|nr:uncharacterized protein MYCFIDRAFT_212032 [Pseudocercospora fijiensis CIRAD86]EME80330.1 hypothetical protein MYCFIDRAFT_212032 [Pseudocercospora fijiensis CIRAD86]
MLAQNRSSEEIAEAFPERPFRSLLDKRLKLRKGTASPSSRRLWSEDEKQRLVHLKLQSTPWLALMQQFPGRSRDSLRSKWRELSSSQLRKDTRVPRLSSYSEQEDALMEKCMEKGMHWKKIAADYFPNRSPTAISARIVSIKEGREWSADFKWTAEIDRRLAKLYDEEGLSFPDIGKILGCPAYAARARHFDRNRGKRRGKGIWGREETQKLLAWIQAGLPVVDIVKAFPERTFESVHSKACKLRRHHGIQSSRTRRSS